MPITIILVAFTAVAVLALLAAAWCCHRHRDQVGNVTPKPRRDPHDLPLIGGPGRTPRDRWLLGQDDKPADEGHTGTNSQGDPE